MDNEAFEGQLADVEHRDTPGLLIENEESFTEVASEAPFEGNEERNQPSVSFGELPTRGSRKTKAINACNAHLREISTSLHFLPEDVVLRLQEQLTDLKQTTSRHIIKDKSTGLPIQATEIRKGKKAGNNQKTDETAAREKKILYGNLKCYKKKGLTGRVGISADVMREATKAVSVTDAETVAEGDIIVDGNFDLDTSGSISPNLFHPTSPPAEDTCFEHEKENVTDDETNPAAKNITQVKEAAPTLSTTQDQAATTDARKPIRKKKSCVLSQLTIEEECKPGVKLSDLVINYAQKKLKTQWPDPGLQSTLLGQNLSFSIKSSGVQILHVNGNHWVTINITSKTEVEVYDSFGYDSLEPNADLKRQVAAILRNKQSNRIRISARPVQKQDPSSNDCGVLAIAFAVSLLMGKSPSNITYDPARIREHLRTCLINGLFTSFPETSKRLLRVKRVTFEMEVFCICRQPYFPDEQAKSEDLRMAQCDVCKEWLHKRCGKIPESAFRNKSFSYKCCSCAEDFC
jgi:hypothetical protein